MAEEIAFENGWISNCEGLVTLALDRVILQTVVHHSLTCTYVSYFIRTYVHTDGHLRLALLGRLCQRVDLKMVTVQAYDSTRQEITYLPTRPWPALT